ncbi:YisL family protein [Alkalihalobacillus sp. BA299]|uniref:YisL family protein n=1 Tax=Alkalihalobacillus sp. BA299 TaxID=2815938 RepID=UPI001ADABC02|nr:YisL family protein [Alkalihalobacillus sp. BA299]
MYTGLLHTHSSSWAITVLLFFIAYFLLKGNKEKGAKIVHMVLRLFYVIMVVSGIGLLIQWNFAFTYVLKGVLAISLIYFMEILLVRTKKGVLDGKQQAYYWIMLIATLMLVVLIGFKVLTF